METTPMSDAQSLRNDEEIKVDVEDELDWSPEINATAIGVAVRNGAVTLSGDVETLFQRTIAKKAAMRVKGVTTVIDEIIVRSAAAASLSDEEIGQHVHALLAWTSSLPHGSVQAEVIDGTVILTGTVDWEYQRRAAGRAVENVAHVRHLDNRITLSERAATESAAARISDALLRSATVDSNAIHVSTHGTVVTLTGTVRTLDEKLRAGRAAWDSPDVTDVHNDITVSTGDE